MKTVGWNGAGGATGIVRRFRSRPRPAASRLMIPSLWFLVVALGPSEARAAQPASFLQVTLDDGSVATLPLARDRGYAAVPFDALIPLGWMSGDAPAGEAVLVHVTGATIRLWSESPMLFLDEHLLQVADVPYTVAGSLFVPLQLVVDLIPVFGPGGYALEDEERIALSGGSDAPLEASVPVGGDPVTAAPVEAPSAVVDPAPPSNPPPPPSSYDVVRGGDRLVVIDAGHGGADAGTIGPGGALEKSVTLSVALALARELGARPGLDVRVIRDRDTEVPAPSRGHWATEWKGERPGVFVSIHANALPERTGVRGFETYVLGEARTDQERRVADAENGGVVSDPRLGLTAGTTLAASATTRDTQLQSLSEELAFRVQEELGAFHPGPDRGVRQAPLAVLAGARMPSVLIEIGFITNPEEERALTRPEFHRQAAAAIARAIDGFFESAPPGGFP